MFCSSTPSDSSNAGILAYAIGKMDGVGGRKGWEWYVCPASREMPL